MMLIVAVFVLTALGLVMVFSSSSIQGIGSDAGPQALLYRQLVFALVGVAACVLIAHLVPYRVWLTRWLDVAWVAMVVLLIVVLIFGKVVLGAKRWIEVGKFSLQPSEMAKIVLVLAMARILVQAREQNLSLVGIAGRALGLVFAPLVAMTVAQSDLGTAIVCAAGLLAVMWIGDVPLYVVVGIIGVGVGLVLVAILTSDYRMQRLTSFTNPRADAGGSGYQLIQSFYAFGVGGLTGVGIGRSTQKYQYLPEAETDFVFAIIGEELGLLGALLVVALFVLLLYAGLRIARNAPDAHGAMIAGASTAMIVFQAFLNIACVVGLAPTTGKPLPFISYGGSSLLGTFILVGLILSVSYASDATSDVYRRRRDELRVVRAGGAR